MRMAAALDSVWLVLVLAGLSVVSAKECPAEVQSNKTVSYEWKLMMSDVVLQGKVVDRVSSQNSSTNYSVIFNVICIFKGAPVQAQIRIDHAGFNPHTCLKAELEEKNGQTGNGYLVWLSKISESAYFQVFKPDEALSAVVDDVVYVCDATVSYPIGVDYNEVCPLERLPDEDCVARPTTTVTPVKEEKEVEPMSDPSVVPPDSGKWQVKDSNKYERNDSRQMEPIFVLSTTLSAVSLILTRLVLN